MDGDGGIHAALMLSNIDGRDYSQPTLTVRLTAPGKAECYLDRHGLMRSGRFQDMLGDLGSFVRQRGVVDVAPAWSNL